MRTSTIIKCAVNELSVGITRINRLWENGIEVDKPLLKNGKNGNFYIKETDTG